MTDNDWLMLFFLMTTVLEKDPEVLKQINDEIEYKREMQKKIVQM